MAKKKSLKRATAAAVEGAAPCSLLAEKIEAMATIMADTAADMEYYGGFSKRIQQHAKDLKGAARIAKTWARGIRKDTANAQMVASAVPDARPD
jgi:hypothetical protein